MDGPRAKRARRGTFATARRAPGIRRADRNPGDASAGPTGEPASTGYRNRSGDPGRARGARRSVRRSDRQCPQCRAFLLDEGAFYGQSTPRSTTSCAFEPSRRIARPCDGSVRAHFLIFNPRPARRLRCRGAISQWRRMKKVLEIIAVIVVVLCLIGAGVVLSRGPGADAPAAPGGVEDEAPSTHLIGGAL